MSRHTPSPPPTHLDAKGRPRTKWDELAERDPPRTPRTVGHRGHGMTPMLGLSDDIPPAGLPRRFTKRFT